MFGHEAHGPAGKSPVTRREFFSTAVGFLTAIPFLGLFGSLFRLQSNFHPQGQSRQDSSAGPVTVYKMVPLPGRKYNNAETRHMANKIFPSIEAARARRPHDGFVYGLKSVPLSPSLTCGMDGSALFCNRKDFDQRVHRDQHHWQNLGVDVAAVFGAVGSA